jgi:hypothetical protein
MEEDFLVGDIDRFHCSNCGHVELGTILNHAPCTFCGGQDWIYDGYSSFDDNGDFLADYDENGRPIT